MGVGSSFNTKISFFRPFHMTSPGSCVGGLLKYLMYVINYLHNGNELEKIFFLNFNHFHSRQPFRPISRPEPKWCRQPVFFKRLESHMKIYTITLNLTNFQDKIFPFSSIIQFLRFWQVRELRIIIWAKIGLAVYFFQKVRVPYENLHCYA